MRTSGLTLHCNSRSPNSRDGICAPRARYTLGHGRAGTTRSRHHASSFIIQGLRIQLHTKPHETGNKAQEVAAALHDLFYVRNKTETCASALARGVCRAYLLDTCKATHRGPETGPSGGGTGG